jgi:hypothetical protein
MAITSFTPRAEQSYFSVGTEAVLRPVHLTTSLSWLILLVASSASSRTLRRSVDIHRPFEQVYDSLSNYFSPDSMHDFQVLSKSRSKSRAEFVARRSVQGKLKWSDCAFCKVAPATARHPATGQYHVRVKLERESANHTYVTVTPQFEGVYEFAGNSTPRQCTSRGVLEKDILLGAGAADTDLD